VDQQLSADCFVAGRAATLLLEHLKQQPMPILDEERERVRVGQGDDVGVANKEGQNQGAAVRSRATAVTAKRHR